MADISSPKEFLTEMLAVVDALQADQSNYDRLSKQAKTLKTSLDTLINKAEKEKKDSVNSRRSDLASGYDKQIKAAASEVNAASEKRQKELNKLIKQKTADATADVRKEAEDLKASLADYGKEHKLPGYLTGRLYYALFCPGLIGYIIYIAAFVILLFFSLAMILNRVSSGGNVLDFVALLAIIIILFVAYVLIWANTRVKHRDEIADCLGIINNIKAKEKRASEIEKSIKSAGDDNSYDLGEFDTELSAKKQKSQAAEESKQRALDQFDSETAETLRQEIDLKYKDQISELNKNIEENSAELKEISAKIAESEKTLTSEYVSYVGAGNMTHDKITQMIKLIDDGDAATVTEAISKLKK